MTRRILASPFRPWLVGAALLALGGCSGVPVEPEPAALVPPATPVDIADSERVKHLLYTQLDQWRGVPYRYGGLSKKGIDCSGFVYLTFLTRFGVTLPRRARLQQQAGTTIPKEALRAGDLVFFETGGARHVGIYIERNRFIHASESRGVTLSSLENPYWTRHFFTAERISQ